MSGDLVKSSADLGPKPPGPMNHVKRFKGWPPRDAPGNWYNCGTNHVLSEKSGGQIRIYPTRLSNKISTI